MTSAGPSKDQIAWDKIRDRKLASMTQMGADPEFSLEDFRLELLDMIISFENKIAGMELDAKDKKFIHAVYQAVYGKSMYKLYEDFCENPTLGKHSEKIQYFTDDLKKIFDPTQNAGFNRAINAEMQGLKGRMVAQMEEGAITRTESLKLLILIKSSHRRALGKPPFDCEVADITELEDVINRNLSSNEDARCQIILHNTGHYTAVDCRKKNGVKEAIIMDAGQDDRMEEVKKELEEKGFKVTIIGKPEEKEIDKPNVKERIQFDHVNCAFFSYDNLVASSRIPTFFEDLAKGPHQEQDGVMYVPWKEMPAAIIRNAQSVSFMDNAVKAKPKLGNEPVYMSSFAIQSSRPMALFQYADVFSDRSSGKQKQTGIQDFRRDQKRKMENYLEKLSDQELVDVVKEFRKGIPKSIAKIEDITATHQLMTDVMSELESRSSKHSDVSAVSSDVSVVSSDVSADSKDVANMADLESDISNAIEEERKSVKELITLLEPKTKSIFKNR